MDDHEIMKKFTQHKIS